MSLEEMYQTLLTEAVGHQKVLGVVLGGSRGKDATFLTEHSDYDVVVILDDAAEDVVKTQFERFSSPTFDVRVCSLSEFTDYAAWGTEYSWDRYNFAHNTPALDKTGSIASLVKDKGTLPEVAQKSFVTDSLDSYINSVYRSAKYWRDGKQFAALLDASESLPYLMDALYGLEGRVKPYNKYFEWELEHYPLALLPWPVDEFVHDYKTILTTGDLATQEKIFTHVKRLFSTNGYAETIDAWKGKYFVG